MVASWAVQKAALMAAHLVVNLAGCLVAPWAATMVVSMADSKAGLKAHWSVDPWAAHLAGSLAVLMADSTVVPMAAS